MPRPGSQVIDPRWAAHHRPTTEATFGAQCSIRHPGGTGRTFNQATGTTSSTPHPPYASGPCRIQVLPALDREQISGEQQVSTMGYRVSVEWDTAGVLVDDLLTVDAVDDNGDPTLVGRTLTVRGVARGSLAWQRDLTCTDDLG